MIRTHDVRRSRLPVGPGRLLRALAGSPVRLVLMAWGLAGLDGPLTTSHAGEPGTSNPATWSVARRWNEALLEGIRLDVPNPPVHARNLYHLSAALWDAFWAYERDGWNSHHELFHREVVSLPFDEAVRRTAQQQAMSHAARRVINRRFARSPGSEATLSGTRALMVQLGLDPDFDDATLSTPASVGLRIADRILSLTLNDGANEANGYADASGYRSVNPPLVVRGQGVGLNVDPNRWQPLDLANTVTQNGITLPPGAQTFVGSNARNTKTFALARAASGFLVDDPGPPPRFTSAEYRQQAVDVITYSSQLSPTDGAMIDISPGAMLNNPLGTNDGRGHPVNPITGRPYEGNLVPRGDYARILAEYWADGPNSETPPGHWNVVFNQVSDHALATHRLLGAGAPLDRLMWDVCGYMALNSALHDAACAAWTLKWQYDSARPITMIRHMAGLGQSTNRGLNYHPNGLPLIPGLIELVTPASSAPGQRHAALAGKLDQVAVRAWLGTPPDASQTSGVGWVLGASWMPYQRDTFVTPAFPAYVSGHSAFSRAAAEVLTRLTGSAFFPGGLATYDFPAGTALTFENGPSRPLQLQWATYIDAADQAGLSRLYGGIHIAADDFMGRKLGAKVGVEAFERFLTYLGTSSFATTAGGAVGSATAPVFVRAPASVTTAPGRTAQFAVEVAGLGPMTYQWLRGTTVVGSARVLTLPRVTAADAGEYQVEVRNALGAITSMPASLTVNGSPTLANLSFRAATGSGERALIAGFVLLGANPKNVVVRGIGPGLTALGLPGAVPEPVLTLVNGTGQALGRNERWKAGITPASLFAGLGAFPLASGSADSALHLDLSPGSYTAVVTDSANRTGTALVEIYEADETSNRLVNLSARAVIGPDPGVGIAGFVVRGTQPGRYLIRGIGPTLGQFGVNGTLADPALTLTTSQGTTVAENNDWGTDSNFTEIAAAASQVGAFPLAPSAKDAALLVTLAPGAYTAILSSANGTTGVAVLEVYEVTARE